MAHSLSDPRLDVPRKSVAASISLEQHECKKIAVIWKARLCQSVDRALTLANMTRQEVSFAMGYPDASAISRWIAGTEPTQWHKLMAIDQLRPWIPVALAEQAGVEVETTVRVRRSA